MRATPARQLPGQRAPALPRRSGGLSGGVIRVCGRSVYMNKDPLTSTGAEIVALVLFTSQSLWGAG